VTPDLEQRWRSIVDAERAFQLACAALTMPEMMSVLHEVLPSGHGRETALRIIRSLPDERVMELVPQLYQAALISRSDILVPAREALGRVDSGWLFAALAPEVERTLPDADDEVYRRLAELLDHLGQEALLARVVTAAEDSDDEDILEVADDFRRE
jgi:hypothetical protein